MRKRIFAMISLILLIALLPAAECEEEMIIVEIYDAECIDFSEPPPDYDGETAETDGEDAYREAWGEYLRDKIVRMGEYYVLLSALPPDCEESEDSYFEAWYAYLLGGDANPEEDLLDFSTVSTTLEPDDTRFTIYDVEDGKTAYTNQWLAYYRGTTIVWDGWIFDTTYPPPNYVLEEDPWYEEYSDSGYTEEFIAEAVIEAREEIYGYGDCWREFFEIADVWVIVG